MYTILPVIVIHALLYYSKYSDTFTPNKLSVWLIDETFEMLGQNDEINEKLIKI